MDQMNNGRASRHDEVPVPGLHQCIDFPLVFRHRWLDDRKSIRPVKYRDVSPWPSLEACRPWGSRPWLWGPGLGTGLGDSTWPYCTAKVGRQEGHPACKNGGDGGGGHWLVRMDGRPAGWSVCLRLLIFPCTIKSRSSLLAPAHPGGPGKRAVKWLWVVVL